MQLRTRLTREALRTHLQYFKWIYLLLIAVSIGLVNLIYIQTAYRPPKDKRIDLYIQSGTADQDLVNAWLKPLWQQAVPEQELVEANLLIGGGGEMDYYANVQLATYLQAGEGDIYLLQAAHFKRLAAQGVFVDLAPAIAEGILDTKGIALDAGKVTLVTQNEAGEAVAKGPSQLFGIPAAALHGLQTELNILNQDLVLAVARNSGNEQASLVFLNALIGRTLASPPTTEGQTTP